MILSKFNIIIKNISVLSSDGRILNFFHCSVINIPRIARLLNEEEHKRRGKSIFTLTEDQKDVFLEKRIIKRLKKQKEKKEDLDLKSLGMMQQIQRTEYEIQKLAEKPNREEEEEKNDSIGQDTVNRSQSKS